MSQFIAYTDYPIPFLGDENFKPAPIREVMALVYDGDKYVTVGFPCGRTYSFKSGYLYLHPARHNDKSINAKHLKQLRKKLQGITDYTFEGCQKIEDEWKGIKNNV